jgi:hypothetical protein
MTPTPEVRETAQKVVVSCWTRGAFGDELLSESMLVEAIGAAITEAVERERELTRKAIIEAEELAAAIGAVSLAAANLTLAQAHHPLADGLNEARHHLESKIEEARAADKIYRKVVLDRLPGQESPLWLEQAREAIRSRGKTEPPASADATAKTCALCGGTRTIMAHCDCNAVLEEMPTVIEDLTSCRGLVVPCPDCGSRGKTEPPAGGEVRR